LKNRTKREIHFYANVMR